uniref:NADPH oxidase organizer 1b n=1 Tax=Amphilophus citrinellus TaxID=61819 RepID=A0A3Q0R3R3_AMPCI
MADEQRFVFSARIIGGVHRDMFMLSVLWSDQNEIIIYRSFQDFKKFHKQLKRRFPHMNPFRKDDRMIPKFSGKIVSPKGSKKSVRQMKFLESYLDKLLKCDQTVTRSAEVTRFFTPKDHDLQPDYTKNSIMILLSDDLPDGSGRGGGAAHLHHAGSITHPFVTQTYCCVAAYETKDTKNRPFKVDKDEKLDVLIKDPAGWWLVENEDKRLAWFPAPYLELSEGDDDDDELQPRGALYCAVRSYSTKKADEISVPIGSVVEVLRKSDNGWWLIRFNGRVGYIPTMYLQPYNNPRAGLYGLNNRLHSSSLNLATTSRTPQAPYPHGINEEESLHEESASPSRHEPNVPAYLHKAQSLAVLSEPWPQAQRNRERATASDSRTSSMSKTSSESIFSEFSSSSGSSSSLKEETQSHAGHPEASQQPDSLRSSPDLSHSDGSSFNTGSESSGSVRSKGSETASVTPRVPPRPKTEEILTRCTTMTRKAAMATKARLQIQPESIQSR